MLDEYPDIVIGCRQRRLNLGGLISPFMQDKLLGKADPRIIAVEPTSCPSLTRGKYVYDFCDTGHVTAGPHVPRSATASCPRPATRAACATAA